MTAARDRVASRLLDPRWHWLRSAVDRIYAELEPDQFPASLTLILASPDGPMAYSVSLDGQEVGRLLITDQDAVRPTSGYVDVTPPSGPLP